MLNFIENILEYLVLLTQITLVVVMVWAVIDKNNYKKISKLLAKKGVLIALIIATFSTLGSLFYSDILNYEPCKLCWYQRILMYPQILILALAFKNKAKYSLEALVLSTLGLILAGYHYLLQVSTVPSYLCNDVGYSLSCNEVFEMSFGFLTIPLMATTAFFIIAVIMLINKN